MAKEEVKVPEKKVPDKKANASGGNKFLRTLKSIPMRMWNAIQNTIAELKKVTWPSLKDLVSYTTIVIIFMVVMAVVVGLLDLGATELISLIIRRT